VFRGCAVHDGVGRVSSCQVPCPGVMTKESPPSRAMPAWRMPGAQGGIEENQSEDLPASACGCGLTCSACASANRSRICSRLKSARSRKRFMPESPPGRRTGDRRGLHSECTPATGAARSDRRWCRSECSSPSVRPVLPWQVARVLRPRRKPAPCVPVTGPVTQFDRM